MPNSNSYFQYTLADLKERSDQKLFNVVSFFAGGGGSSCGYKLAGGDILCVNEFQQVHADTYNANFPNTPVIVKDIKSVTGKMIGKNGNILKKVIKDYLINNQDEIIYFNPEPLDWTNFDEWYENANIPKLDINNTCIEYTEVKVYYKIKIGRMRFDPIQDFLMKLYY